VPTDLPVRAALPRLADGLELLGELKDSGFADPPSLVRRADGQVIQLSRLLYLVACRLDGTRGAEAIADLVSDDLDRSMTADQVRYVVNAKLAPLGIVAFGHATATVPGEQPEGQRAEPAALPTASPLLTLRARATLLPEAASSAAGTFLRPLFHWPVIAVIVVAAVSLDYWIFSVRGLAAALSQLLANPLNLLLVAGLAIVSALFHECGHAAGCRYGGARPGRVGVGIYLVWPSFFTNVTDSYRLSRVGRLRTDLGGLYFNLIFILVLAACYAASSARILLLVIALTHLEMLEQLLPFVRFDGYFILSDLVGVPDLFARVIPVVKSTLLRSALARPRDHRAHDQRALGLRRPARLVITAWVLTVIPLLILILCYLLLHLPQVTRALWHSTAHSAELAATAFGGHQYVAATADGVGGALALLSIVGLLSIAAGLARRAVALAGRWSANRPRRRLLAVAAALACAGPLALFWLAQGALRDW
jgi:putative peptide zinc metalloprotease protein